MKTPTNIVRFALLGLGLTLAGCGEDPLLLAELIAANDNGEETSGEETPPEPQQPEVDEPPPLSPPPMSAYPEDPDEARFIDLMEQHCSTCHGGPGSIAFEDVTDVERLIDQGQIDPGRKEFSRLYERLIDGSMPPAFIRDNRPSPEDIDFIGDFIDSL